MGDRDGLLLGIDGGGSTTVAWLATPGGVVLGRGIAGASNAKAVGAAASRQAIEAAIRSAFDDAGVAPGRVGASCLGLAGIDHPEDRALVTGWAAESRWAERLLLVNDCDLVIAAGTADGWGIGVIAGTGSIASGRAPDGRTARAGGWGHLIGDEGSAYYVALAALRLLARRTDGRDATASGRDPLAAFLCDALGVTGPDEIVTALYAPAMDRTRIAALAPAVLAAASEDPALTGLLLGPAGLALGEQVRAVAERLGLTRGRLPVAAAGGFLLSAPPVQDALDSALRGEGYDPEITFVPEPVRGAIVLAARGGWSH